MIKSLVKIQGMLSRAFQALFSLGKTKPANPSPGNQYSILQNAVRILRMGL
jgi:hypothetical protein